ncbi:PmoA family protein [Cohnella cellulosilytica]|uniref:PmoA family protein n=1 Tax=Cohnella cellulosilytica TaxID=986710 RepID=A0ABW2FLC6_9BACL
MSKSELQVVSSENSIRIYRAGQEEPFLVQQAQPHSRPYIHPVVAPDGQGVLTENAPPHHPWQHGIYVGLNDVNGVGFWEEGLRGNPADGSFHPKALKEATANGSTASWEVETDWQDPQGGSMLTELQRWRLNDLGDTCELDLEWTLRAEVDLVFGQHQYGGLFLRMPYRQEWGGQALNSEGLKNGEAEGQRARWVACSMPIEGRDGPAGIAFLDHPGNLEFPVPWRVDGQMGIAPSPCIAGPRELKRGNSETYRYRIVVFCGAADPQALDKSWQAFGSEQE